MNIHVGTEWVRVIRIIQVYELSYSQAILSPRAQ
jgi:hypothetical protein